ncbi:hypothetical protein R1sor_015976 [Riccia sorocarpa]|uniref:NADP-dependent oxidoreductase domain-containing protein n=1 Tax=Riccia sorocarpa TaxID=122646 RepID=A0ABD3HGV5_9MARC
MPAPGKFELLVGFQTFVGELKKLVEEGKVKYIGLSEASAADIRRAHAIQIEYSLWARDVEEDIIPTCQELGIGIISYSPLGRGFFSGKNITEFTDNDFRKNHPRFLSENFQANQLGTKNFTTKEVKGDRYADMSKTWRFNSSPPLDTWTGTKH